MRLRDGYKQAALSNKLNGDRDGALSMMRIFKQLDIMVQAINDGKPVDLTGLPPPAASIVTRSSTARAHAAAATAAALTGVSGSGTGNTSRKSLPLLSVNSDEMTDAAPTRRRVHPETYYASRDPSSVSLAQDLRPTRGADRSRDPSPSPSAASSSAATVSPDDVARLFNAPASAGSVLEALSQRMDKYQATESAAKAEGNASKARRLGRIVKQYEKAMQAHKNGQEFDYDSLPAPPGFPPIPFDLPVEPSRLRQRQQQQQQQRPSDASLHLPPQQRHQPSPRGSVQSLEAALAAATADDHDQQQQQAKQQRDRPATEVNAKIDGMTALQSGLKQAALQHKRSGDVQQAIHLMKLAKGFDPIIEAVKCGLPVDESSIPEIPHEVMRQLDQLNI